MQENLKNKVLLVSSSGGHYVQLSLLKSAFNKQAVVWAIAGKGDVVSQLANYRLTDANKETPLKLLKLAWEVLNIVIIEKPQAIVSTGAAPGLLAILVGRVFGMKTLWIDSVANSARLSLSGRIARYFANTTLTQWEHLATKKVSFWGAVL
jgi:UDP-N-acetylglucosamine:LPS N-acetylglucosamine transferase